MLVACGGGDGSSTAGSASALEAQASGITAPSLEDSIAAMSASETLTAEEKSAVVALLGESARLQQQELGAAFAKMGQADELLLKSQVVSTVQRAVYRFWNSTTGTHFYTASSEEREAVAGNLPQYAYEGEAFVAFGSALAGLSPVHRFFNAVSGTHFYTISETEKTFVEANIPQFRYEGVAYFASQTALPGLVPAHRFFKPGSATHFYTRSETERDRLINEDLGYQYEGVAYYVLPSVDTAPPVVDEVFPANGESVPTTVAHVTGKVSDNLAVDNVALVIEGVRYAATITGDTFQAKIPLKAGLNNYTIEATDNTGNTLSQPASAYLGSRVAGGGSHSGALKDDLLYTVGRNQLGQLGLGFTSVPGQADPAHPDSMTLVAHSAQTPVSVMFNQNFSLMLDRAGDVWSWGVNGSGQLGLGTCGETLDNVSRLVPNKIAALSSVLTLAPGYDHALVLKSDGTVWAFGENGNGQLGDGTTADKDCPVQVQGLPADATVIQVISSSASSYALDDQGRVWAWGRNQYGNLGQGSVSAGGAAQTSPVLVPLASRIVMLANGRDHVLALTESGAVIGWGLNASSQLTNALAGTVSTPAEIPSLPAQSTRRVWANGNTSWAMKEIGIPYRWGQRLGNAGTDFPGTNLPVPELASATLTGVIDIGMGVSHWVMLNDRDEYYSLGWNFQGSLGGGPSAIPTWAYFEPISVVFP